MSTLAATAYAFWLLAGLTDFILHRRERLAQTSGVRESALHLVQVGLIGAGVLGWLYLAPSRLLLAAWSGLAVLHAIAGYLDTCVAYPRRRIGPLEQHVHSVLDMAPWIAVSWLLLAHHAAPWAPVSLRQPTPPPALQWGVLLPALLLTVAPALAEFIAAARCSRHAR
jgi:hypothetical protein